MTYKLYGLPLSQPVRSVMWLMLYKRTPFEVVMTVPGTAAENGSRHPSYIKKNPGATIPTLEETDTGFALGEANAILCYLSNKHGWNDVYPTDPQARGRVDWYLHYHHRSVREGSTALAAPNFRADIDIPPALIEAGQANFKRALHALENGPLADTSYLAGPALTLADFAAYMDIGQFRPEFTNLFDFEPFPNVRRWMDALKQVEEHDVVHTVLYELGDLSAGAPEGKKLGRSNMSGLQAVTKRVSELQSS